jgi:5-methylcytosine-specific restriction protein A
VSTRRASTGGWVDAARLEACRRCGAPVPAKRRTFCGKECVHEWKILSQPGYLRKCVFERDRGVCAECGTDTNASRPRTIQHFARGTGHLWQADHIIPVVEGGGECTLANMRTLCTVCHKAETAALRKRMKARRIEAKVLPLLTEAEVTGTEGVTHGEG